jgi:dual specificity phosphatase 12
MMAFYPAKRIPPFPLWVGSKHDSLNVKAATRHNVGLVINCTRDLPFKIPNVHHYRVPVNDDSTDWEVMADHLPDVMSLIDESIQRGDSVLIHCYAGISRSASVAAAYLMHSNGLNASQAVRRIQAAKPETFSNGLNFYAALKYFEETHRYRSTP